MKDKQIPSGAGATALRCFEPGTSKYRKVDVFDAQRRGTDTAHRAIERWEDEGGAAFLPDLCVEQVHDMRATFVTVSLAQGQTKTWVADRTGHRSSQMLQTYRRIARTYQELNLGSLAPLHDCIPELVRSVEE